MKIIEIILKLAFLVSSVIVFIATKSVSAINITLAHSVLWLLPTISLLLGLSLIFNRKSSYGSWDNSKRNRRIRTIEGVLLLAFAAFIFAFAF
jgi:hypothetical protein